MPEEYLQFAYHPNKFWAATLAGRVRQSPNTTLKQRIAGWEGSKLREMCLAIATKLAMLDQVVLRIDRQLGRLGDQIGDERKIEDCIRDGAAYAIADKNLPFEMLVDVDSFLFESRSAYEIVGKFLRELSKQFLGRSLSEKQLEAALANRCIDTRWIAQLRKDRTLFFHETAPWVAARIIRTRPTKFELIVLKCDVQTFINSNEWIDFERFREIYRGFLSALESIHKWVVEQMEEFEKKST